ncbi:hypothetical protein AB0D08_11350 [Kitasatospora sp. NPDC048540]|uniref:hypothetical protein n=1 Tax=unclassified Kitasatospora TaxID=2633591 RepID=UPI000A6ADA2D|nr:hypothetical protein [Kitasatospora sp. MBT63]
MAEDTFFHSGGIYRHYRDGEPSDKGVFVVYCVGHAPTGFGDPSEAAGVAFGWRRSVGLDGPDRPLGSYSTADFTGWYEILDSDLIRLLPESPIPTEPAPQQKPRRPLGQPPAGAHPMMHRNRWRRR